MTVTITQAEYDGLLHDQRILDALRHHGVDNWDGWDESMRTIREWEWEKTDADT